MNKKRRCYYMFSYWKARKKRQDLKKQKSTLQVQTFQLPKCQKTDCKEGKRIYNSISQDNQGSATLESTFLLPLFLFAMWGILSMCGMYIAESKVQQASIDTAECLAEYAYLDAGTATQTLTAQALLQKYLAEDIYVKAYVEQGVEGVHIANIVKLDEEKFLTLEVRYQIHIQIPVLGDCSIPMYNQVRQKTYVGYQKESQQSVQYVYITENQSVYHCSRSCSHIRLQIWHVTEAERAERYKNLRPCRICKGDARETQGYLITSEGDCYHTTLGCSGLKRTVTRVPMEEVRGLGECKRCGR